MKSRGVWSAFLALAAVLSVGVVPALAQQGRVTGTVRSESGLELSSVTVQVEGREVGVLTNENGRYTLEIAPGTHLLRATLIGYAPATRSVTVTAGETTQADIVMTTTALELGSVVASVTAREARRVELGTDISRFNAEEAADESGATNFSDLLNARTTGVSISESSGSAGTASRIRIRGSTSVTQDNNPIIYIDGVRVSNATGTGPGSFDFANGQTISRLDDINPQEIASVQVLKGPTAAALYGSEAAAGVILIETKQGGGDDAEIRYSHRQGVTDDVEDYWDNYASVAPFGITDVGDERIQAWRPIRNPVTGEVFVRHNPLKNPVTDPFRTARNVQNLVSIRGASAGVGYFGSLSHETQEGTFRNNDLERVSLRGNFNVAASDELDVSVSTSFVDAGIRLPDNDRSAVGMITNGGAGLPLFSFGTTAGGTRGECLITVLAGSPESLCAAREGNLTARYGKLETIRNEQDLQRFIGSTNTTWRPLDWLTNRLTLGVDYSDADNLNLVPLDPDRPFGASSDGLREEERITSRVFTLDATTSGSFDLTESLSATTSVGTQVFRGRTNSISCAGQGGFASPAADACDAALTFSGASDQEESIEVGGYGQQQLAYEDFLFVTGAVRVDDNSAFGSQQDVIWSPSANASAVVSSMPFWNVDAVNNLRLRFAWGKAAQAPGPFAQNRTFEPIRVAQGGSPAIGVQPKDPGNEELTAERNEEFELGLDAGILDGRVGLTLTYYDQKTTDAILPTDVPPSTGFTGTRFVNIGAIENSGFEASLDGAVIQSDDVRWNVRFQLSTQDPVITDLGGIPPIIFGLGADHQMHREGFAPGEYWGHEIASAERDGDGNIVPGSVTLRPGNVGDPGRPNDRALGRPFPGNEQSLSTTLTLFGKLRVYTLFERAGDYVKLDDSQNFRSPFIAGTTTSGIYALRQANSTPEEQAAMEVSDFARNALFIQDASFVKWREATVRYELPSMLTDLVGPLSRIGLTVGARNLVTFTDYDGLDPELSFDGGRDSFNAAEFFTQPPGRTFFASVDLVF